MIQRFLRLAQSPAHNHGHGSLIEPLGHHAHRGADGFLLGRKNIVRTAVGAFDHQHIAGNLLVPFIDRRRLYPQISGVKQALAGCLALHQRLRGPQAVARRIEGDGATRNIQSLAELQLHRLGSAQVVAQQQPGTGSEHRAAMPCRMIRMGVGDDRGILLAQGIEPQSHLREIHSPVECHVQSSAPAAGCGAAEYSTRSTRTMDGPCPPGRQGLSKVFARRSATPNRHSCESRNPETSANRNVLDSRFRGNDGLTLERPWPAVASGAGGSRRAV